MNTTSQNPAPIVNALVEQFKSKGYTCHQVKENEVTLIIFKHGKRQEVNHIASQSNPRKL